MVQHATSQSGYHAARDGLACYLHQDGGYLHIEGPDRLDFLQRQTTNDVQQLRLHRTVQTVVTSPTARILDVLVLLEEPDGLGVITLPGRGALTAAFLRSRIFFMDKVTLADLSGEVAQIDLVGPGAAKVLDQFGAGGLTAPDSVASVEIGGQPVQIVVGAGGLGHRLLVPASASQAVLDALTVSGVSPLTADAFEVLRVESGLSGPVELSEDNTPLEVGLRHTISDSKGCYTGQEVIARQITYDKVTKQLIGLRCSSPVEVGASVFAEGRQVGSVTSSADSPHFGPIALAVLRRPYDAPGTSLQVGNEVDAKVCSLPFADALMVSA